MEPNLMLAIAAMIGSVFFMAMGYVTQRAKDKQKCETTEFMVGYAVLTAFVMLAAGMYYLEIPVTTAGTYDIMGAFAMGLAGNAGFSKLVSFINIANGSKKQIEGLTQLAEVVGDAVTPDPVTATETPDNMAEVMRKAKEAGLIKE